MALLDDLLPWIGQRRSRLGARHVTIVVLINKKTLPIDGFQHVRVASTCGVGQKRSQREAPVSAVTLSLGQTKSTSQTLHQKAKSLALRTTHAELTRNE